MHGLQNLWFPIYYSILHRILLAMEEATEDEIPPPTSEAEPDEPAPLLDTAAPQTAQTPRSARGRTPASVSSLDPQNMVQYDVHDDIHQIPSNNGYMRTRSGLDVASEPGIWIGEDFLGRGGNGIAGLWVKKNDDGRIIDVCVSQSVHKESL